MEMCKLVDSIFQLHCKIKYVKAGVTRVFFHGWNNTEEVKQHFSLLLFHPSIAKKKKKSLYTVILIIQTTARDGRDT